MLDNDLKILIQTIIDEKLSVKNINQQLSAIANKVDKLKIKIDVDATFIKELQTSINNIQSQITEGFSGSFKGLDKYTEKLVGEEEKLVQKTKQYTDESGRAVKVVEELDKKTKEFVQTEKTVTEDFKKQRQEAEKLAEAMAKGREKSGIRVNKENLDLERKQAQAINKSLEENYKIEQKAREQMDSAFIESQNRRRKELEKTARQEAVINNKRLEENYKLEQRKREELKKTENQIQRTNNILERMKIGKDAVFADTRVIGEVNTLKEMEIGFRKGTISARDYALQMDKVKTATKLVSNEFRNVNHDGYNFIDMLGLSIKKIAIWGAGTSLVYGSLRQISQGLIVLRELDTLMVEVAKVTNLSADAMERLKKESFDAASAYGRTAQDYLKSVAEFSRAGYENQSKGLSELSLLAQNVGELTGDQANQFLLATDAAYQYKGNLEQLSKVLDGINQIDNKFATSIQKVSEGMTVAGSIAKNANVGVNELAAAVGTMTAITQRSGNEAGRAFRSILMNIRQIKGETEDGEIIDDEALSKSAKALDSVGIKVHELRNGIEELRNPMDVLKQLSSIWGSLSTMKQAPIIEALGGKYRGNQLVALLENFSMYEKMLNEFANSANSAMIENEKRLDSWQSKANRFSNTMAQMWNNTISTNFVKTIIDLGTAIVFVTDKIGLFNIVLLALSGIIAGKFLLQVPMLTNFMVNLASSMGIATGTAVTLGAVLGTMIPIAVIMAGIGIFNKLYVSVSEQKQKVIELSAEYDKLQAKINELENLENKTEKQKEYLGLLQDELDIKRDLLKAENIKSAKKEVFGENIWGKGIQGNVERQLQHLRELQYQEERMKQKIEYNPKDDNARKNLDNIKLAYKEIRLELIENKKIVDEHMESLGNNAPKELKDKLQAFSDQLKTNIEDIKQLDVSIQQDTEIKEENTDATNDNANANQVLASSTEAYTKEFQKINSIIDDVNKAMKEYNDNGHLSASTIVELVSKYPQLLDQLKVQNGQISLNKDAILNLSQIEMNTFIQRLESEKHFTSAQASEVQKRIQNLAVEAEAYNKAVEAQRAAMAKMYPGENWAFGGSVNPYTSQKTELEKQLEHDANIQSKIDAIKALAEQARNEGFSATGKKSKTPGEVFSKDIADAKIKEINYEVDLNQKKEKTLETQIKLAKQAKDYQKEIELTNKLIDTQKKTVEDIRKANIKLHEEANQVRAKSKFKDTDKWFNIAGEESTYYIEKFNKATKAQQEEMQKVFTLLQKLGFAYNKNTDEINQYTNSINANKQSIVDINETIKQNNEKIANDIVSAMKDAYREQEDLALASIDAEIDALNDAHDKKMDLLDEELDKYNDIIDAKLKSLDRTADEEDYNLKLNKAQQQRQQTLNKINVLKLDDSFEAKAQRLELEKELADQTEEIEKMQTERQRDLRKQNLEDQLDSFKDEIDAKKKTENQNFKSTKASLDKQKKEIQDYYDDLINNERYYADLRNQIINGQTDNVKAKLQEFLDDFKSKNKDTVRELGQSWQGLLNIIDNVQSAQNSLSDVKSTSPSSSSGHEYGMSDGDYQNFIANGKAWEKSTDPDTKAWLKKVNDDLRKKYGIPDGAYPSYHEGGIVGGSSPNRLVELANKLFNVKPGEMITKSLIGELQIPPQNIMKNFIPNLQGLAMAGSGGGNNVVYNLNLNVENINGNKDAGQKIFNTIVTGLKKMGKV